MSLTRKCVVALAVSAALCSSAAAASKEDAKAMVEKAVTEVGAAGLEPACAAFNDPKGGWVKGELYVFVIGMDGTVLAHGGNPKMVGKSLNELRTADGKLVMKDYLAAVNGAKGEGWVDYKWSNPETKKIQDKTTFVRKIPGKAAFAGCGIYK